MKVQHGAHVSLDSDDRHLLNALLIATDRLPDTCHGLSLIRIAVDKAQSDEELAHLSAVYQGCFINLELIKCLSIILIE